MTERERIEEVRKFLKFKKKEFAELLGYAFSQNYTNYLNGSSNLSIKMLRAIKTHIPTINSDWILSGNGKMFLSDQTSPSQKIINGDNNHAQIGDNSKNTINSNNSNTKEVEYLKSKIDDLNKVIKTQEAQLKDKERLISMLEKN